MADNWYYVQKGNRNGPVAIEVIETLLAKQELKTEDFVWKKGFENWKKIKDVSELQARESAPKSTVAADLPPDVSKIEYRNISLKDLGPQEKVINVRIGSDRKDAAKDVEYGPFTIEELKRLFDENRINGMTSIFILGTKDYKLLGDFPEFKQLFNQEPPKIVEANRRSTSRKPFIARLFIHNNKKLFEGICRDISIGGMQVLLDDFQGKVGDKIAINVHPENSDYRFTAAGEVVRLLEGNAGFSFRFHSLSDEAKRSIEKYLQVS